MITVNFKVPPGDTFSLTSPQKLDCSDVSSCSFCDVVMVNWDRFWRSSNFGVMGKHTSIFLLAVILLTLLGLILMFYSFASLKAVNVLPMASFYKMQNRSHSATELQKILELNHTYCANFGQKPTAEEAIEERHLLDSIAWPGPLLKDLPVEFSSDPSKSYFVIQGPQKQHVGDQLVVNVHVQNFLGLPKNHGGDFLIARLHSPKLGAGVAGKVTDHRDGNYTVLFPLLWSGEVQVEITVVHPSEAVAVLKRLQEDRPDRIFFKSLFRSGSVSETTFCNPCLPSNQKPLCNFSDPITGEPWYCYKPKNLGCDTRINHATGGYTTNLISKYEAHFFQSNVNLKVRIPAPAMDKVTVLSAKKELSDEVKSNYNTTGYYFNGIWRALNGASVRQFNNASAITRCLKGKIVYMFGDSTLRQWFEYLTTFVPDLKLLNLYTPHKVGPFMAVDIANNILLSFRCHGPPMRIFPLPSSELHFVTTELDRIHGGPNAVVLLSVWAHFSSFPIEMYIRRLRHVRKAVLRLMNRDPATLVVIRTANLQALNPKSSMYNNDWICLQIDAVLRAMFKGLNVKVLDAWEMTLAHHLPHNLHPPKAIIKNMLDVILSYICPAK